MMKIVIIIIVLATFEKARQALDGGASGVVLPYMETVDQVRY